MQALLFLDEVAIVDDQLGDLHEQTWVVLQLFETWRGWHFLEIFDEVAYTEFLKLRSLVFIRVDQELNYIIIIYILHESILAQVL